MGEEREELANLGKWEASSLWHLSQVRWRQSQLTSVLWRPWIPHLLCPLPVFCAGLMKQKHLSDIGEPGQQKHETTTNTNTHQRKLFDPESLTAGSSWHQQILWIPLLSQGLRPEHLPCSRKILPRVSMPTFSWTLKGKWRKQNKRKQENIEQD